MSPGNPIVTRAPSLLRRKVGRGPVWAWLLIAVIAVVTVLIAALIGYDPQPTRIIDPDQLIPITTA